MNDLKKMVHQARTRSVGMPIVPTSHTGSNGAPTEFGSIRSMSLMLRCYVVAVYEGDDGGSANSPANRLPGAKAAEGSGIFCDVFCVEPGFVGPINTIPMMSQSFGIFDTEYYRPRPVSQTLDGQYLNLGGGDWRVLTNLQSGPTGLHDMDGDCVVVGFFGGDVTKPVILGQLPHPRTENRVKVGGLGYKRRSQVRGNSFGVFTSGEVEVDLRLQSTGSYDATTMTPTMTENEKMTIYTNTATITIEGDGVDISMTDAPCTIRSAGNVFKVDGGGVEITLKNADEDTFHVHGAKGTGSIKLGEEDQLQRLPTIAFAADVASVLNEWLPTIMAAAGFFSTSGVLVETPKVVPNLLSAINPADTPGGSGLSEYGMLLTRDTEAS